MEFEEAFQLVIEKWPAEIDISDIKFHTNGGASIPELTSTHDQIEEQCMGFSRQVRAIDWSLFQYFHSEAKRLNKSGVYQLKTQSINIVKLKELYIENTK